MKTTTNFIKFAILIFAISFTSCSKDGDNGPIGTQGEQGIQGEQGEQGPAGEDGEDGNANVQVFKYDISEKSGWQFKQDIPEITADVLENYLILGYIRNNDRETSPIPTSKARIGGRTNIDIAVNIEIGTYEIMFYRSEGSALVLAPGSIDELKIIIAKSSDYSGKTARQSIMKQLKETGVDLNDYYAVMDYFGLEY